MGGDQIKLGDHVEGGGEIGPRPETGNRAGTPTTQEQQMARDLVQALSGDFHPQDYHDHYRAAVEQLADAIHR